MKKQQAGAFWDFLPALAQRFRRQPQADPYALRLEGPRSRAPSVAPAAPPPMFQNTPQLPANYPQQSPQMEPRPRWNIFDVTRKRRAKRYSEAMRRWQTERNAYIRAHPGIERVQQRVKNIRESTDKNAARERRFRNLTEHRDLRPAGIRDTFPTSIRHYADIPFETVAAAKERGLIFFYNQMHTLADGPGRGEVFEPDFEFVDYRLQRALTDDQRAELRNALRRFDVHDLDTIAEEVFHMPLGALDQKLKEFESGKRDSLFTKLQEPLNVLYEFTDEEVKPQGFGSYLERYMKTFFMTPRDFSIQEDVAIQGAKCQPRITGDLAKPITNLQGIRNSMPTACILLFSGLENLAYFMRHNAESPQEILDHPFIIVDYSMLNITTFHTKHFPYTVEPEHLLEDDIVRDAFANNAVTGIEQHLEGVLAREKPQLIQHKENFITLFSPKYTNYLNLLRFADAARNARIEALRFMILDFELPHNAELYALYPNILQDRYIREQPKGILLCDAVTLYNLRRDLLENEALQALYTKSFTDPNLETYQNTLNDLQKLVFCYVQYSYAMFVFNNFMSEYGPKLVNALTRKNTVKINYIIQYIYGMMKEIFNADASQNATARKLFLPFENPRSAFWPGLMRLQEKYFPRNLSHMRQPADIRLLLAIFQSEGNTRLPVQEFGAAVGEAVGQNIARAQTAFAQRRGITLAPINITLQTENDALSATRSRASTPGPAPSPPITPGVSLSGTPATSRRPSGASQGGKKRTTRRRPHHRRAQ